MVVLAGYELFLGFYAMAIGAFILVLGSCLNDAVIVANGGKMPVFEESYIELPKAVIVMFFPIFFLLFIIPDKKDAHICVSGGAEKSVRLSYLGDCIRAKDHLISVGDLCITTGRITYLVALAVHLASLIL